MARVQDLRLRRGTAAQWVTANPILNAGEPGYETDTGILRIGDGATAFTSLPGFPVKDSSPRGRVLNFRAAGAPAATGVAGTETVVYTTGVFNFVSGRRYRFTVKGIVTMSALQTGSQGSVRVRQGATTGGTLLMNCIVPIASTGLQGYCQVIELVAGTDFTAGSNIQFAITNLGTASSSMTTSYSAGQLYTNTMLLVEDIGT